MSLALCNNFNSKIEILLDEQDQPWIHRAQYVEWLSLPTILMSISEGMSRREQRTRAQLLSGGNRFSPRSGTRGDGKNPHDTFLSMNLALYVAMRCDKKEAIPIRNWMIKDIMPRGLNKIIGEHQLAMEDLGVQFHTEIRESDFQLQALNDENERFYNEIQDYLENMYC